MSLGGQEWERISSDDISKILDDNWLADFYAQSVELPADSGTVPINTYLGYAGFYLNMLNLYLCKA